MRVRQNRFYRASALISALLFGVCTISCRNQEKAVSIDSQPRETIRIGLIPEQNVFNQRKRYEPLADYLSKKVGVEIELRVLSAYGNVLRNFVSSDLDAAFFGSFTGALAQRRLGVEALARPEYPDGSSTYHGLIFGRSDSEIRTSEDMKGKRFVFVDRATTAGWLLPLYYFKTHGIENHRTWLKETYFAGTHEGAIYDVLERNADIGAAKNTVFDLLAKDDPRIYSELTILTRSPNVPENALCVRTSLDDALKTEIKETLLNMDQDIEGKVILKEFGVARFISTTEEDYDVVFDFAAEVGLDLETYDHMND